MLFSGDHPPKDKSDSDTASLRSSVSGFSRQSQKKKRLGTLYYIIKQLSLSLLVLCNCIFTCIQRNEEVPRRRRAQRAQDD